MHVLAWCFRLLLLSALLGASGCSTAPAWSLAQRPALWAQPAALPSLSNDYQVDVGLYRAAQPDDVALQQLFDGQLSTAQGVHFKTVLSLRASSSDARLSAVGSKTRLIYQPLNTWDVNQADILAFLQQAILPENQPMLVHCRHGADRTGTMIAAYRVVVQGWSKADALNEMQSGGFGFHPIWSNLPAQIERLDVAKMRADLGLRVP